MRKATAVLFTVALTLVALAAGALPSLAQTDATVQDVQSGAIPDTTAVRLRGVIVTAVYNDVSPPLNASGFWVQDPPSGGQGAQGDPYSGIFVYTYSASNVSLGDSLTVVGAYIEYYTQSEIDMRDCLTLTGIDSSRVVHKVGAVVPAPRKVVACDLGPDGALLVNQNPMEQWEGVLVEVDSVRMKSDLANGEWSFEEADGDSLCVGLADTALADDKMQYQQPPVGIFIRFLRGVMDETFNEHKIQPRGDFDIVFESYPAPAPEFGYVTSNTTIEIRWTYPLDAASAQNIANYSLQSGDFALVSALLVDSTLVRLTTGDQSAFRNNVTPQRIDIQNVKNVNGVVMSPGFVQFIAGISDINFVQEPKSVSNDSSRVAGYTVCVAGVVTMGTTGEDYNSGGGQFFLETSGGGPKSGIYVVNSLNLGANLVRGDSVRVAGLVVENFFKTRIGPLDYVSPKLGTKAVPGPDVVSLATAKSEGYEGVLVRVNGPLRVDQTWPGVAFNEIPLFALPGGTDSLFINDADGGGYPPLASIDAGDTLCFVIGCMDTAFARRPILPRNARDLCIQGLTGIEDGFASVPVRTRLEQNHPNPFNPKTTISFALSKPGQTSLVIYDLSGREVRVLVNEPLKAAEYAKIWDGRNSEGREVASGIYFYKLTTSGFEETRKMVLLK